MAITQEAVPHTHGEQLKKRSLGVPSLVFLIIAASAPLTVLAGGVPSSFAVTELLGVPLSYLALGLILVFFAVGYGAMSARISNAGAFYAYVAAGLGKRQGLAASGLALVSYNLMQVGLYGIFGFALSSLLATLASVEVAWWICALVGWAIVAVLGVSAVDFSAKVLGVLVVLEFVIVIVVNFFSFQNAPEGISTATIEPSNFIGVGLGTALAFGIAAFMGFESGAIYSEETKDPQRSVPRTTFIAVGLISLFYAFSAWALSVGIGPSNIIGRSQELGPDLPFVMLDEFGFKILADLGHVVFITSLLAALVAFHNSVARYFFSLGRERVIPSWFGKTSDRSGAPQSGSIAQTTIGIVAIIIFAVAGNGSELGVMYPVLTMFTWLTNAAAFGLIFLLVVTSLSIIRYFNNNPYEHGILVRVVFPVLALIGLSAVFVLIMMNFDTMIGDTGPASLVWIMPAVIILAGIIGFLRGEQLRRSNPEIFEHIGQGGQRLDAAPQERIES
ncbi:MAG: APC family permease [Flaviflexus sp.]|uniref:APC family permease n=1 Tax=Flaviflexus sp. TaxID=1969482 RepID=UPI003F8F5EFB